MNEAVLAPPLFAHSKSSHPNLSHEQAEPSYVALAEGKLVKSRFYRYRRHFPAGFRVVVGERAAELISMERLVSKVVTRQVRNSVYSRFFESNQIFFLDHQPLLRDVSGLEAENERLKTDIALLRRIIEAQAEQLKGRETEQLDSAWFHAAELLAIVDEAEADVLMNVLQQGNVPVKKVAEKLGCEATIRLSNLIGNARLAIVNNDAFVATLLGKNLYEKIIKLTSKA